MRTIALNRINFFLKGAGDKNVPMRARKEYAENARGASMVAEDLGLITRGEWLRFIDATVEALRVK